MHGVLVVLEQLLAESEDDSLRRQVRGVLGAVGVSKDPSVPRVSTSTQPPASTTATAAAGK